MKLTVQIKLLPSTAQSLALKKTLELANNAANHLSKLAWESKEYRRFPMQRLFYKRLRSEFPLSAQIVVRLLAKVADAYKTNRKTQCVFHKFGSISYDARILSFQLPASTVSLWSIQGRLILPFVCGERQRKLLALPKGESDLIMRNNQWFLNVTIDVPEQREQETVGWLGIDLGLKIIARDSDGRTFGQSGKMVGIRERRFRQRKRLHSKGSRSAKRVLGRLRGRESRFAQHENHMISKQICAEAKRTGRGVAMEDLRRIRDRKRASRKQRRILHSWAFADLQTKIAYKCRLAGVPVRLVEPRNTSITCLACGSINRKNRRTRDKFACQSCGHTADADTNAAGNIARLAAVAQPDKRNGVRVHV